jgi:hypothetical protein
MQKYRDYEYLMVEFSTVDTKELLSLYYKTKEITNVNIRRGEEMVTITANLIYDNGGDDGVDYLFHGPIDINKQYKKGNLIKIIEFQNPFNREITYFSEKSQLEYKARPSRIHLLKKKEYETLVDQDLITKVYYRGESPLLIDDVVFDKPKLSQYEIAIRTWLSDKNIKNIEVVEETSDTVYRLYNITNPTRNHIYFPKTLDSVKTELDSLEQNNIITDLVVASKGVASKGGRTRGRRTRGRGAIRKRKRTNRINRICRRSRNHPHNRIA